MIDKIDKQQIRLTILELLKLNNHDPMPSNFGVCYELYDNKNKHNYNWCLQKANMFGTDREGFVSQIGYMNPKRREFCHYLLDCLDKEPDND